MMRSRSLARQFLLLLLYSPINSMKFHLLCHLLLLLSAALFIFLLHFLLSFFVVIYSFIFSILLIFAEPIMGRGRGSGDRGRQKRPPLRNLLTRMQEVTRGPMSVLRDCMINKRRVKVRQIQLKWPPPFDCVPLLLRLLHETMSHVTTASGLLSCSSCNPRGSSSSDSLFFRFFPFEFWFILFSTLVVTTIRRRLCRCRRVCTHGGGNNPPPPPPTQPITYRIIPKRERNSSNNWWRWRWWWQWWCNIESRACVYLVLAFRALNSLSLFFFLSLSPRWILINFDFLFSFSIGGDGGKEGGGRLT